MNNKVKGMKGTYRQNVIIKKEDSTMAEVKMNIFIENMRGVVLEGLGINDSDGERDDWWTAMDKFKTTHIDLFKGCSTSEITKMREEFYHLVKDKKFNEFGDERA